MRRQFVPQRSVRPVPIAGISKPAPQAKMQHWAKENDLYALVKNQGTTRLLVDSILIDGRTEFSFFLDARTRSFPDTNITSGQGLLEPGELFALDNMRFYAIREDTSAGVQIDQISAVNGAGSGNFDFAFYAGEVNVFIDNQRIDKAISLLGTFPDLNGTTNAGSNQVYTLQTNAVISPLKSFEVKVRVPTYNTPAVAGKQFKLACGIEGAGSIWRPKSNS